LVVEQAINPVSVREPVIGLNHAVRLAFGLNGAMNLSKPEQCAILFLIFFLGRIAPKVWLPGTGVGAGLKDS
jgi:hypothetical protein